MNEILRFFDENEIWIYILLGLVGLWYLRKAVLDYQDWRGSFFGLERDNAQRRLSSSASILVLVLLMMGGEFILVSFVAPVYPSLQIIPTPTLDILASPTTTLAAPLSLTNVSQATGQASVVATFQPVASKCVSGQIEFTDPTPGQEIKGKVTLRGSVNLPNFGFYKYEFSQPGQNTWTTIQAGDHIRCDSETCADPTLQKEDYNQLGDWDTSLLVPGDYYLRLVVVDIAGNSLPACVIPVRVLAAQ
ncbi:MAG: hypothetical protein M1281_08250 [Chloroflexi bacterium]|nr:hypothetical protein [Chloroflexota bacterium]